jgi:hypothetical protein
MLAAGCSKAVAWSMLIITGHEGMGILRDVQVTFEQFLQALLTAALESARFDPLSPMDAQVSMQELAHAIISCLQHDMFLAITAGDSFESAKALAEFKTELAHSCVPSTSEPAALYFSLLLSSFVRHSIDATYSELSSAHVHRNSDIDFESQDQCHMDTDMPRVSDGDLQRNAVALRRMPSAYNSLQSDNVVPPTLGITFQSTSEPGRIRVDVARPKHTSTNAQHCQYHCRHLHARGSHLSRRHGLHKTTAAAASSE